MSSVEEYIKNKQDYLAKVSECVKEVQSGVVSITFRVYNGKVTDMVKHNEQKRFIFTSKKQR